MHASIVGLLVALLGCAACSATEIVFNGAVGTWGAWDACPDNSYAAGMWTKSQADHGAIDDTAMNGVRLLCKSEDGTSLPYTPQSSVGERGTWDTPTHCPSGLFVVGFMVRFQECCSAKDDTALNRIIFICNNPSGTQKYYSPELGNLRGAVLALREDVYDKDTDPKGTDLVAKCMARGQYLRVMVVVLLECRAKSKLD
eukprot:m51a1_g5442 hypothetical protein (199) ;mRNA; f:182895-189674